MEKKLVFKIEKSKKGKYDCDGCDFYKPDSMPKVLTHCLFPFDCLLCDKEIYVMEK